jgi:hypothetical protein
MRQDLFRLFPKTILEFMSLPRYQQQFSKALTDPSPKVDSALPSTSVRLLNTKRAAVAISQATGPCSKPGVTCLHISCRQQRQHVRNNGPSAAVPGQELCPHPTSQLNDFRQALAVVTFRQGASLPLRPAHAPPRAWCSLGPRWRRNATTSCRRSTGCATPTRSITETCVGLPSLQIHAHPGLVSEKFGLNGRTANVCSYACVDQIQMVQKMCASA